MNSTSAEPPAISIRGLTKRYGPLTALKDLNLDVAQGEVIGFLGLNGAGKTTTIRLLLDLLRPTSGKAFIFGHDCWEAGLAARARVGYLPGELGLYPDLTGLEVLDFLAGINRQPVDKPRRQELFDRLELPPSDLRRKLRQYSTGMKRKLGLIQAFQADPPLLILDEPTEGLDPLMQESFYSLLKDAKQRGRTIFMSSHVLSEVERVCDRIALLRKGELVLLSGIEAIRRLAARRVRVFFNQDVTLPAGLPPGHELVETNLRLWQVNVTGPLAPLLAVLARLPVADLEVQEARLEDVVLTYYRGGTQRDAAATAETPSPPRSGGEGWGEEEILTRRQKSGPSPRSSPRSYVAGRGGELSRHTRRLTNSSAVTGPLLLLALSLKRARALLFATGLLLAAFQVLTVAIAGSIQRTGEFEQLAALLPPFVRALLGPALASVLSFSGIVCLGYFDLAIVVALLALIIALATVPASEVETGFADLILARPFPRHWIITRTVILILIATLLLLALMVAGTWLGLAMLAPDDAQWPPPSMIGSLALNLGLLMFCWGGVAMAFGAACRRSVASATTGLLALAALLLDLTGRLWPPAERFAWLSPFRYFIPFDLVMGTPLPVENALVLWAIAMSGFTIAYALYSQRDISR